MDYLALDGLSAAVQELQSQTEVAKVLSCIVDAVVDAGGRALVDELRVELEHALGEARGAEAEGEGCEAPPPFTPVPQPNWVGDE